VVLEAARERSHLQTSAGAPAAPPRIAASPLRLPATPGHASRGFDRRSSAGALPPRSRRWPWTFPGSTATRACRFSRNSSHLMLACHEETAKEAAASAIAAPESATADARSTRSFFHALRTELPGVGYRPIGRTVSDRLHWPCVFGQATVQTSGGQRSATA
jgi:hypothetical protein